MIARPVKYPEFYKGYIQLVPDGDVVDYLEKQLVSFLEFVQQIPAEKFSHVYAPGKWSVGEVIGHIIDTERVMSYRVLRFSRADGTPIPGFEENHYISHSDYKNRPTSSLVVEFRGIRTANLEMIRHFTADQIALEGVANDVSLSVNALVYIIAGHLDHHVKILKERYL